MFWSVVIKIVVVIIGILSIPLSILFALIVLTLLGIHFKSDLALAPLILWAIKPLAERGLYTDVPEGYAKFVSLGGNIEKVLIQHQGKKLDNNWNVVDDFGPRWRPLGGYRWMGFGRQIYKFGLKWGTSTEDGKVEFHDETLEHLLLKQRTYYLMLSGLEDADKAKVTFGLILNGIVVNPYKFVHLTHNPFGNMTNLLGARFASFVGQNKWEDIVTDKENAEQKLKDMVEDPADNLIDMFLNVYGFKIIGDFAIKDIGPDQKFQDAAAADLLAQKRGEAAKTLATLQADAYEEILSKAGLPGAVLEGIRIIADAMAKK